MTSHSHYDKNMKECQHSLLKSFILSGKEIVMALGKNSSPYEMSSDVPQESVLGSFLFVAYINGTNANLKNATILKPAANIKL